MTIWMVAALALASALGTGLIFLAIRRGTQKAHDYQAFAQAEGWEYTLDHPSPRTKTDAFRDPGDDWTLRVVFQGDGAHDGMTRRHVEWHSPQGALDQGQAALGMPLPEKSVHMLQMGGEIGKQILEAALKATFHALGQTRFSLAVDKATAGDPGGVVLATPGQEREMERLRRNMELAVYRDTHKVPMVPVVIRDEDGLTLRRPDRVRDLSELTELVTLGKALREDLLSEG